LLWNVKSTKIWQIAIAPIHVQKKAYVVNVLATIEKEVNYLHAIFLMTLKKHTIGQLRTI